MCKTVFKTICRTSDVLIVMSALNRGTCYTVYVHTVFSDICTNLTVLYVYTYVDILNSAKGFLVKLQMLQLITKWKWLGKIINIVSDYTVKI